MTDGMLHLEWIKPTGIPVVPPPASKDVMKRAKSYLGKMPAAISGKGGHNATYKAAVALVHGFGLNRDEAMELLKKHYNPRCEPPWSDTELEHKVNDALTQAHDMPKGWLRDKKRPGTDADESIPEWQEQALINGQGGWRSHTFNVDLILSNDERIAQSLRYNLLTALGTAFIAKH